MEAGGPGPESVTIQDMLGVGIWALAYQRKVQAQYELGRVE